MQLYLMYAGMGLKKNPLDDIATNVNCAMTLLHRVPAPDTIFSNFMDVLHEAIGLNQLGSSTTTSSKMVRI